jgi:hypothetical protein
MGHIDVIDPYGYHAATVPVGVPVHIPSAVPGMWAIAINHLDGHYIINKTSGFDRGVYVTWQTWGYGDITGSITVNSSPNTTPSIIQVIDTVSHAIVQNLAGVTNGYTVHKVPVGFYWVKFLPPPPMPIPDSVLVTVWCEGHAVADFHLTIVPPNQPPHCEDAYPDISEIWPPNHQMVDIQILGVTDVDGDPVLITVTGITQDEPLDTFGDGHFEPDGAGLNTSTAQVRAERSGTKKVPGNGRVYAITFTADDGKGGICEGQVSVCVPHDQRPGHACIDDGRNYDSVTGDALGGLGKLAAAASAGGGDVLSNYPNPFNPETTIRYSVPDAAHIRLTVYNILGQVVQQLIDAPLSAGVYTARWDGRNTSGVSVAAGLYLFRLEIGHQIITRKMLLAR